jgi:mitochondrial chaperone BCS1
LYIDEDAYRLSLSGLLNALDGVGAQEGRILFATTNKYSALDPALCRPGRMDLHIEFKNASKYQARELFSRFYLPTETSALEDDVEEITTDSGYESSSDSETSDLKSAESEVSTEKVNAVLSPTSDLPFTGTTHTSRIPKLSRVRIAELAERFAEAIPERECSMASLQGYLMAYKTRPVEAADNAGAWVESERAALIAKASEKEKERMRGAEKELKEKLEKAVKDEKAEKEKAGTAKETEEDKPILCTDKLPETSLPSPVSPTMSQA